MTVWVVFGGWNFEGNDDPDSVWTSLEKAEERGRFLMELGRYDGIDILDFTLDVPD